MHRFWAELNPQFVCETPGGKYRADFRVVLVDDNAGRGVAVCVECDGHDFHEKTKAQAARDKKRDRDLTADGTPVLHYTGSEIWRNPEACAREVMARLRGRWNELYGDR
jgi:very-short-patch-repair endonuclease